MASESERVEVPFVSVVAFWTAVLTADSAERIAEESAILEKLLRAEANALLVLPMELMSLKMSWTLLPTIFELAVAARARVMVEYFILDGRLLSKSEGVSGSYLKKRAILVQYDEIRVIDDRSEMQDLREFERSLSISNVIYFGFIFL